MDGFKLTEYQLKDIKNWLEFVHPDVEDALLANYMIQGLDQLKSNQYDEIIDFIQDTHVKLSYNGKRKK